MGGNPLRYVDPQGLLLDEAALAAALDATATAVGVAASTVAAAAVGVAAALYPSPAGEGSDQPDGNCDGKDPCKGLRDQLKAHQDKLRNYRDNPYANDNKGFLSNSPIERHQQIIDGRISNLERQIKNFKKLLEECERKHGK